MEVQTGNERDLCRYCYDGKMRGCEESLRKGDEDDPESRCRSLTTMLDFSATGQRETDVTVRRVAQRIDGARDGGRDLPGTPT